MRVCAAPTCRNDVAGRRSGARYCSDACRAAGRRADGGLRRDRPQTVRVSQLTQKQRVMRLLRQRAERGITQVDFHLPHVADGGKPISRLAARINNLKELGVQVNELGWRNGFRVYALAPVHLDQTFAWETPDLPGQRTQATRGAVPVLADADRLFDDAYTATSSPYDAIEAR